MRVLGQRSLRSFVTCLMTVLTSVPFGVRAGRRMAECLSEKLLNHTNRL